MTKIIDITERRAQAPANASWVSARISRPSRCKEVVIFARGDGFGRCRPRRPRTPRVSRQSQLLMRQIAEISQSRPEIDALRAGVKSREKILRV